jgi:hypothetical protein
MISQVLMVFNFSGYVGDIQSFSANNLTLVLYINNFKIQEPFPHHAVEHGKSEWDSGTL